jgi:hypothetical protein
MSNPTTPFSWQMPTATDLVTDLPADFEVFGQAVATSMADLLGGTSGQILAKNSNTDMDFVWVANDVGDITAVTAGTGISGGGTSGAVTVTNSMATAMTTKGDLVPATGSGAFARLAAGANNLYLVADSTAATGLKYEGAITSWTPTFTGLTVGNGTLTAAEYQRVGNLVFCYIQFVLGSTSAITGDVNFTLPIGTTKRGGFNGTAYYVDAGTGSAAGTMETAAGNGYFRLTRTDGTWAAYDWDLSATRPWTWTTNDSLRAYFYYEVA